MNTSVSLVGVIVFRCLQINLIAPPLYVVTTTTLERSDGLKTLNDVLAKIEESILADKGMFAIRTAVRKHPFMMKFDSLIRVRCHYVLNDGNALFAAQGCHGYG